MKSLTLDSQSNGGAGERKWIALSMCLFVIITFFIPYLLLGRNAYLVIHDNLDSEFVARTVLIRNHQVFTSDARVEQIMNGLPRGCLRSGYNAVIWLFAILGPFAGYIVNKLIVHIVAFIGMYLLLKEHILSDTDNNFLVAAGVSLCFALLPFFAIHGLSVAGQPLLFHAFFNLRKNRQRTAAFIIILLFCLYSSLAYSGVFLLAALGIILIWDCVRSKKLNKDFLLGIVVMSAAYIAVEHDMIRTMFFDPDFVSNRTEWDPAYRSYGVGKAAAVSASNFLFGQYHAASSHTFVLAVCVVIAGAALLRKQLRQDDKIRKLFALVGLCLLISIIYGFYNFSTLNDLKRNCSILQSFQWDRLHWLQPLLWYIIFALGLSALYRRPKGRVIVPFLIVFQLLFSTFLLDGLLKRLDIFDSQVKSNELRIDAMKAVGLETQMTGFADFFSKELFEQIEASISEDKSAYRVVSIGLYPSIAQYNGFYTLDGYQFNYPLEYKHRFRRIIRAELEKSIANRAMFDSWGSRCYILAAELEKEGFLIDKNRDIRLNNLSLNTEVLKDMGGKYVFSAIEVVNAADTCLELCGVFETKNSPYRVFLYKVK